MERKNKATVSTIYSRIYELASQHKISLAELERSLQFSNGIISTWKSSNPSIDKISKVANYFDVSTDYLLGNTDDPSPISNDHRALDLENELPLTYRGQHVPEEYLEIVKKLMDSDFKEPKKHE
ncbi:helix-turn-helix domain-containing protein [Lactobacillus bombicola]|uniref:helix-turn-helix domain-containing protein n=1 Tax=Lactobacillus bombicola TaxID=1505723 RepID=UPI0021756272|nr:helix-turn-helix transcriptional regulator [Lactobacillus bombicola]